MAVPKKVEGHAGQTVDELLTFEGTEAPHMNFSREVNNGDTTSFFRNSSRRFARVIVAD